MSPLNPRVVAIRRGQLQARGSWVYVWIDIDTGAIAYVGGTAFDPELRTFLHVSSEDPQLGRVRATVPRYDQRNFDVLAFELPADADRSAAKQALVSRLAEAGEYEGDAQASQHLRHLTDPIVQAIIRHRSKMT